MSRVVRYRRGAKNPRTIALLVLFLLLLGLFLIFQGDSQSENPLEVEPQPSVFSDQNGGFTPPPEFGEGQYGDFPTPTGNLPGVPQIPPDLLPNLDEGGDIGGNQDWGITNVDVGGGNGNPIGSIPTIPSFGFPNFPTGGIGTLPSVPTGGITPPNQGGINVPTVNNPDVNPPDNSFSFGNGSFSLPQIKKDPPKSRYMPRLDFSFEFDLGVDFGGFNINIKISVGHLFLAAFFATILFVGGFLTPFLTRLTDEDFISKDGKTVVEAQVNYEEIQRKKEELARRRKRQRRLMKFRDYVEEIREKTNVRKDKIPPEQNVIMAYHDLDQAFGWFTKLRRQVGDTPLEHAKKHFETGEIDNSTLEEIVHMFYLARFGHRRLSLQDLNHFIECLNNLVPEIELVEEEAENNV